MKSSMNTKKALSQKAVSEKIQNRDKIVQFFQSAQDREEMNLIFQIFFTQKERKMLSDRYEILQALLLTDLSQREIAAHLKTSISKITAGSKEVQRLSLKDHEWMVQKMKKVRTE